MRTLGVLCLLPWASWALAAEATDSGPVPEPTAERADADDAEPPIEPSDARVEGETLRTPEEPDERVTELGGQWRWLLSRQDPFPLNAAGEGSGLGWYLDQRLRVGLSQEVDETLRFEGELELLNGQVVGDYDRLAAGLRRDERETLRGWDLKNAELRRFAITWKAPWFELRAGHMGSHFGLGLLAHDGRDDPTRFGAATGGDLSDRLILATRPLAHLTPDSWAARLVLAVGGGVTYRDENADLRAGDVGGEALLSVFYREEELFAGLYVAGRFQKDEDGDRLDVVALDLAARWEPPAGESGPLVAAEAALLVGRTSRIIQAERLDGVDVLAGGGLVQVGWRFKTWRIEPVLEVGFASGDANPHDGTVTQFSFDPNLRVGLVLFDALLRGMSAMAAAEAADPQRVARPQPGVDQLATHGRVSNAIYFFPTLRLRPWERISLRLGVLGAWSAVEFGQSFQTFNHGGVPTNAYGKTRPGRELGWELDAGLSVEQPVWDRLRILASLEVGWFMPGSAFERPDGSRPGDMVRLLATFGLAY